MRSYSQLLRDPRWQRKRLEILQRSDFSCEACGDTESTLNVHHKLYRKGAMPWEYSGAELQALCENCHKIEHMWRERLNAVISRLDSGSLELVVGYAEGLFARNNWEELDKTPIPVRSGEHAEGLLAALWNWNSGDVGPNSDRLVDHRHLDGLLVCRLGEGEMPHPRLREQDAQPNQ